MHHIGMTHAANGVGGEAAETGQNSDKMSIAFLAPARQDAPLQPMQNGLSPLVVGGHIQATAPDCHHQTTPASSHTSSFSANRSGLVETEDETECEIASSYASSPYDESQDSPPKPTKRKTPRPPASSYSEEQKFLIMFARIVQDKCWLDIENDFAAIFGDRTRGGLTSVYYRIRKSWGLDEVLKSGKSSYEAEKRVVDRRAENFSRDFLLSIGYLR